MAPSTLMLAGAFAADVAARGPNAGTRRTELQRNDLSTPGREVVQVRVDFDPGTSFPRHMHPGEEIVYVEGQPPKTLEAGDVLFVPAGTIHAAKDVGGGNAAELATYVVEEGKPLTTIVE